MGGDAKAGNTQAGVFLLQQFMSAGFQGGAGGYHIIHQEQVLTSNGISVDNGEFSFHILPSVHSSFFGLSVGMFGPGDHFIQYRQVHNFRHALAEDRCLVISSFSFPLGEKRQRDQRIWDDTGSLEQLAAHQPAQVQAKVFLAFVFQQVQELLHQ